MLKSTANSFNLIISFQVLEVGFDVLHFVATCNASNWLIHSTRLSAVEGEDSLSTALPSNKKQRLDPLVDDTKKNSDEDDDDDDIITISDSDSEETYSPNSSHRSKRKRQSPKKGSSREHEKQSQVEETLDVNSKGGEEEDGEPSEESGKRKRPASPTTW